MYENVVGSSPEGSEKVAKNKNPERFHIQDFFGVHSTKMQLNEKIKRQLQTIRF